MHSRGTDQMAQPILVEAHKYPPNEKNVFAGVFSRLILVVLMLLEIISVQG